MNSVLKISEAASLALHTMQYLAANPDRPVTTHELAEVFHASEAHLAKVLQRLGKAGLVRSNRGPKGGFVLGRKKEEITLLQVYETIEGPVGGETCLLGLPVCGGPTHCMLGGLVGSLNHQVASYLSNTTLAALKPAGA